MTNYKDERYEAWKDLVASVAKSIAREFPRIEADDLYQDLWLWVYSHGKEHPDNASKKILRLVASKAAWRYRKQHLTLNDQYAYRIPDVRRLVENYLFNDDYYDTGILMDQEVMGVTPGVHGYTGQVVSEDGETHLWHAIKGNVPIDYTDRIVAKSDIERAFERLSDADKEVIVKVYRDGLEVTAAEERRVQRAIEKMTDYLNYNRGENGSK